MVGLQLPPEIRNRIWRFALAGNLIHIMGISSNGLPFASRVRDAICEIAHSVEEAYPDSGDQRIPPAYNSEHEPCQASMLEQKVTCVDILRSQKGKEKLGSTERRLNLSLLQTCRQVHIEASLIPYSDNTFVLAHGNPLMVLKCFILGLALEQARPIRSLSFVCSASHGNKLTKSTQRCLANNLKGLQHLDIMFEFLVDRYRSLSLTEPLCYVPAAGLDNLRDTIGGVVTVRARNVWVSKNQTAEWERMVSEDTLRKWEG
ncbi:hypothetical protein LTS14_000945 [Recurvomyces mirabilis]|uniref:uncharacterized protein n=1 Tax=Recurvomyces mirabilis TaxID=574656 RepID=UPI002DE04DA1|nr:hypothetical protein LTS14_000945 [Recurvomyces mirabilis]